MLAPHGNSLQRPVFILLVLAQLGFYAGSAGAGEPKRPELILPLGHADYVSSVALSVDSKRVLTGSFDMTAVLWDADSAKPIQTFKGHNGYVTSVALSGDGKRVLTGSHDQTAILWDAETAKPLHTFKGHGGPLTSIAFAPQNAGFVTTSSDGTVRIWNLEREEPVFSFLRVGEDWLFWTPEGYYTCSPNGESLIAWKINDDSPQGYRIVGPEQFRKQFHRPDLFRHLLTELDLTKALALADKERGRTSGKASNFAEALPPDVIITRPLSSRDIIKTEDCDIAAKAVPVGDNFVTALQLLVDGRPYPGKRALFEPTAREAKVIWKVPLPAGKRRIQVEVESVKGSTALSQEIEIIRADEQEAPPTLLLLAVGISAYQKINRGGTEYAADDAKRFLEAQVKHGKALYPPPQTIALTDGKATRAQMLQAFAQLSQQASAAKNPVTLIFLAGHGLVQERADDFYFLTADSDPEKLEATAISGKHVQEALRLVPGKVVIFVDACHSGAFAEKLFWQVKNDRGVVMICSSQKEGESLQSNAKGKEGGYFTLAVVEGLSGAAAKDTHGNVNLLQLFAYVNRRVQELSRDHRDGQQRPYASEGTLTRFGDVPLTRP